MQLGKFTLRFNEQRETANYRPVGFTGLRKIITEQLFCIDNRLIMVAVDHNSDSAQTVAGILVPRPSTARLPPKVNIVAWRHKHVI